MGKEKSGGPLEAATTRKDADYTNLHLKLDLIAE